MNSTKTFDTVLTVVGLVATTFEVMIKTFRWYEKRHNKKKEKKEDYSRPIIKGV